MVALLSPFACEAKVAKQPVNLSSLSRKWSKLIRLLLKKKKIRLLVNDLIDLCSVVPSPPPPKKEVMFRCNFTQVLSVAVWESSVM